MANVITQIYGCETIKDAQIAAALGVDHIGCGFGEIAHLPNQKNCAQARSSSMLYRKTSSESV